MSRVLLLVTSASYRAGAFLAAAREIGLAVTVGTDRRQVLADAHPEGNLTLDFDDPPRMVEEILAFAEDVPIDAVVATDDAGAVPAAMAGAALGLRHAPVEAVLACRDKFLMRVALERAGLPGPRFERIALGTDPAAAAARAPYPCVLKPLALAGSRGVIRADDAATFVAAFRRIATLRRAATRAAWAPRPTVSCWSRATCREPRSRSRGWSVTARCARSRCSTSPIRSTVRSSRRRST
jgi:biotin carboxylase